jgi:hypothetical protein
VLGAIFIRSSPGASNLCAALDLSGVRRRRVARSVYSVHLPQGKLLSLDLGWLVTRVHGTVDDDGCCAVSVVSAVEDWHCGKHSANPDVIRCAGVPAHSSANSGTAPATRLPGAVPRSGSATRAGATGIHTHPVKELGR